MTPWVSFPPPSAAKFPLRAKRRPIGILLVSVGLFLGVSTYAQAQAFPWDQYQEVTLLSLIDRFAPDTTDPTILHRVFEPPQLFHSTVTVEIIGAPMEADMASFLQDLPKAMPETYGKTLPDLYRSDLVFNEHGKQYTTPVLNELIPFLKNETVSSQRIDIYYVFTGLIDEKPVLLIREFHAAK